MPRASPQTNEIYQSLFQLSQNQLFGLEPIEIDDFDSFKLDSNECPELCDDLMLLAPLRLERQHGRIYDDETTLSLLPLV